jgi:preprotein translocase subunit YajC
MLISPAYAQAATDTQSQLLSFAPLVLIFIVFYFFMIRPQQQKSKQLKLAQAGLRRGDRVITSGGIIATVARVVTDDEVELTIADNVRIRVVRSTISTILAKTEPGAAADKPVKPKPVRGRKPEEVADETPAPSLTVVETKPEETTTGSHGGPTS